MGTIRKLVSITMIKNDLHRIEDHEVFDNYETNRIKLPHPLVLVCREK